MIRFGANAFTDPLQHAATVQNVEGRIDFVGLRLLQHDRFAGRRRRIERDAFTTNAH